MSLVAYDASSDEESDYENEDTPKAIIVEKPILKASLSSNSSTNQVTGNGQISDEDDDFVPSKNATVTTSMILPLPRNNISLADVIDNFSKPTFTVLPTPKVVSVSQDIEEEDDEFLHKKPNEDIIEKEKHQRSIENKKMPVKITIPSLKNFKDVDKEVAEKAKNKMFTGQTKSQKSSGLLNLLPKAKSEQNFTKMSGAYTANSSIGTSGVVKPAGPAFVPDAVKLRRPATNTEDIDRIKINKNKTSNRTKPIHSLKITVDSDESDGEEHDSEDFFSFNTEHILPEISCNEINALVAKKAAKIAETTTKYLNEAENHKAEELERFDADEQELENSRKRYHQEEQLNSQALQALVGGSLKRRRQQNEDIQVIDINSEQVLPNKEEWMRTALASSTTYQPTGVLVDEEPASGTRRKHQITYLAHKAKANEAELQAMWSANRQNRRATQSKYGF